MEVYIASKLLASEKLYLRCQIHFILSSSMRWKQKKVSVEKGMIKYDRPLYHNNPKSTNQ